jgi:hypothetical protein
MRALALRSSGTARLAAALVLIALSVRWLGRSDRAVGAWPTRAPGAPASAGRARHKGPITRAFLDVLEALLCGFHNSRLGCCFPSYEADPLRLDRKKPSPAFSASATVRRAHSALPAIASLISPISAASLAGSAKSCGLD